MHFFRSGEQEERFFEMMKDTTLVLKALVYHDPANNELRRTPPTLFHRLDTLRHLHEAARDAGFIPLYAVTLRFK